MPGVTTAYQAGNHAGRPAANAGCILYACSDHNLIYRSDGSAWATWANFTPTAVTFSGARVNRTTSQVITTATLTAISFDAERFDTDALHDNSTNPTRLTIPTSGKWMVGAHCEFDNSNTGYRDLGIRLGGGTFIAFQRAGGQEFHKLSVATIYDFAATNYIEAMVRHTHGSNLSVIATANFGAEFWAYKLA